MERNGWGPAPEQSKLEGGTVAQVMATDPKTPLPQVADDFPSTHVPPLAAQSASQLWRVRDDWDPRQRPEVQIAIAGQARPQ
jgi:hypothetical protein